MTKKITCTLLVDDDSTTNYIHSTVIRSLGVTEQLEVTHNGQEAITFLKTQCLSGSNPFGNCPDLILLDIKMPVMDGFQFLEELEKLPLPKLPTVVMLTTSMHPLDQERARGFYSVKGFLTKPLTKEALDTFFKEHFEGEVPIPSKVA